MTETTDSETKNETAGALAEKPAWLPAPFWDEARKTVRLEALAKSQADLRRLLSAGRKKAPEAPVEERAPEPLAPARGTESLAPAGGEGVRSESDGRVRGGSSGESERARGGESTDSLDPASRALVAELGTWTRGLVGKGVLAPEGYEALRQLSANLPGVQALIALRRLAGERGIMAPTDSSATDLAAYYKLVRDPKHDKKQARHLLETLERAGLLPDRLPPMIGVG